MLLSKETYIIQAIHYLSVCVVPWELNPQPFALLTQCSTTESHHNINVHVCVCVYNTHTHTHTHTQSDKMSNMILKSGWFWTSKAINSIKWVFLKAVISSWSHTGWVDERCVRSEGVWRCKQRWYLLTGGWLSCNWWGPSAG